MKCLLCNGKIIKNKQQDNECSRCKTIYSNYSKKNRLEHIGSHTLTESESDRIMVDITTEDITLFDEYKLNDTWFSRDNHITLSPTAINTLFDKIFGK